MLVNALAGCGQPSRSPHTFSVGMVTATGGLGDRSFNDAAYAGLQAARTRLRIHTALVQSRSAVDYQANLSFLASNDYDETIAISYSLEMDLTEVAKRFPEHHFAIIDGTIDAPNVTSVSFKEQEGSFLAGALAARTSVTKTIGFLGGMDIPEMRKFEAGFRAGARQIDPAVNVLVKYIGSYDDVPGGKELAGILYEQHADIIFVAAGKAGLGAIGESKRRRGTYIIGVDSDQDDVAPGKILTSVLKRIDLSVLRICTEAKAHRLQAGRVVLGLKEGGVGLTDFRYTRAIVTPGTIAELTRLRAAIIAGTIVVPFTREQLALFHRARTF